MHSLATAPAPSIHFTMPLPVSKTHAEAFALLVRILQLIPLRFSAFLIVCKRVSPSVRRICLHVCSGVRPRSPQSSTASCWWQPQSHAELNTFSAGNPTARGVECVYIALAETATRSRTRLALGATTIKSGAKRTCLPSLDHPDPSFPASACAYSRCAYAYTEGSDVWKGGGHLVTVDRFWCAKMEYM